MEKHVPNHQPVICNRDKNKNINHRSNRGHSLTIANCQKWPWSSPPWLFRGVDLESDERQWLLGNDGQSWPMVGWATIVGELPGLVMTNSLRSGKSPGLIGKSTISMAMASIAFCMFTRFNWWINYFDWAIEIVDVSMKHDDFLCRFLYVKTRPGR